MHPDLSANQLKELKDILQEEKARLERAIARALRDGPVKLDQQAVGRISRMDALMNEGLAQGSISRAHEEIGLVYAALDRIDSRTYGFCRTCKKPIDPNRLLALPEALHCSGCRI
jgi:RNA polymerase-binding transcription factor